jgi:hypothetical protein
MQAASISGNSSASGCESGYTSSEDDFEDHLDFDVLHLKKVGLD